MARARPDGAHATTARGPDHGRRRLQPSGHGRRRAARLAIRARCPSPRSRSSRRSRSPPLAVLAALHYAFWPWRLARPGRARTRLVRARTARRLDARARAPPPARAAAAAAGAARPRHRDEPAGVRLRRRALLARGVPRARRVRLLRARPARPRRLAARARPRRWNLDTYLREDLPAALDAIRAATGEERVLYVGHSQGAILGMAACALYPDADRGARRARRRPPTSTRRRGSARSSQLRRLAARRGSSGSLARMVAPFSGYWHPAVAELAINMRNVERPSLPALLANAIENLQPGRARPVRRVHPRGLVPLDGRRGRLPRAPRALPRSPRSSSSAEKDGLAPPAVVEAAFRRWGGPKRYWSCGRDYGHARRARSGGTRPRSFPDRCATSCSSRRARPTWSGPRPRRSAASRAGAGRSALTASELPGLGSAPSRAPARG